MNDASHKLWKNRDTQRQALLERIVMSCQRQQLSKDEGSFMIAMALIMVAEALDQEPVDHKIKG